jgi:hypothetical protein
VTQTTLLLYENMQQHMRVPLLREPQESHTPQHRDRETLEVILFQPGHTNIAAACRRLAAQPAQALALIGIEFEN